MKIDNHNLIDKEVLMKLQNYVSKESDFLYFKGKAGKCVLRYICRYSILEALTSSLEGRYYFAFNCINEKAKMHCHIHSVEPPSREVLLFITELARNLYEESDTCSKLYIKNQI